MEKTQQVSLVSLKHMVEVNWFVDIAGSCTMDPPQLSSMECAIKWVLYSLVSNTEFFPAEQYVCLFFLNCTQYLPKLHNEQQDYWFPKFVWKKKTHPKMLLLLEPVWCRYFLYIKNTDRNRRGQFHFQIEIA